MTSTSPPVPQPSLPRPAAPPPAATTTPAASPPSATPPPAASSPAATPPPAASSPAATPPPVAPSPAVTPPPVAAPRPAKTPPSAPPSSSPASSPPPSPESSPPPVPESSPPPEPKTPPSPPAKPETPVARSPPAPSGRRLSPPSPPSESKSNGVSTTVVVAVVAGAAVAVLLVLILAFLCCRKRKRRDGGVPPPGGYYYQGRENYYGEQWHHQAPLPPDTNAKLPPHFSPPPAYASRPPLPPPPPPVFSSSGGSASNNSGSENPLPSPSTAMTLGFAKSAFSFEELTLATDGFSNANLLGQGGFGYVHRGVLPNGKEVAVKQLKTGSGQGEREFQAEVEIISRVHHKHLVSLVGYCITGDKRLLVYEFVPNNTLEFHLHGKGRPTMEWPTRLKIALGAAKGLAYLHEDCHPKIIHRDIKAANILLDYKFEAKVSDFGLAKFTSDANTHVSTRVMGTFGYLAPEYATSGKLSDKSDVFSFGVMLLELITGRRPVDTTNTLMDDSLVDWARPLLSRALEDGNYDTIADPRLQKKFNANEMARAIACAAACVRHSARRRPRMTQVARTLEGDSSLDDLNEGVLPGHSSNYGSYGGSDYDSGQYMEDMKKFRKVVLASQEHASSGYSAATSEYGLNPSASSSEAVTREMDISKTGQESEGLR